MTIRALIFLTAGLISLRCFAQYHDPALDGINLNLGYVNGDMNGNLGEIDKSVDALPNAIAMTNYALAYKHNRESNSNHVENYSGQDMNDVENALELGAQENASLMSGMISNVFTNFSKAFNLGSTNHLDGQGGTNHSFEIPLLGSAGSYFLTFSNAALQPVGGDSYRYVIYHLVLLIAYIWFATLLVEDLKKETSDLLNQRQIQGTHIAAFGFEVSGVVAVSYAIAVTVFLATCITALFNLSFVTQVLTGASASDLWSYLGLMSAWPMWDMITSWVPVTSILILFFAYLFFRYIMLTPLFFVVRALIFWLVV